MCHLQTNAHLHGVSTLHTYPDVQGRQLPHILGQNRGFYFNVNRDSTRIAYIETTSAHNIIGINTHPSKPQKEV